MGYFCKLFFYLSVLFCIFCNLSLMGFFLLFLIFGTNLLVLIAWIVTLSSYLTNWAIIFSTTDPLLFYGPWLRWLSPRQGKMTILEARQDDHLRGKVRWLSPRSKTRWSFSRWLFPRQGKIIISETVKKTASSKSLPMPVGQINYHCPNRIMYPLLK